MGFPYDGKAILFRPEPKPVGQGDVVEIRIGVAQSVKEIEVDLGDVDREKVIADITKTLSDDDSVLWLTDRKGRTVGVPAARVAYIEIGAAVEERRVGFAR